MKIASSPLLIACALNSFFATVLLGQSSPTTSQSIGPTLSHAAKTDIALRPAGIDRGDLALSGNARLVLPAYDAAAELRPMTPNLHVIGGVREMPRHSVSPRHAEIGDVCVGLASIVSPGATEVRVHFTDFSAAPDEQIFVYSAFDKNEVYGPYTSPAYHDDFWSPPVAGEEAIIEIDRRGGCDELTPPPFDVDRISHIFEDSEITLAALSNVQPLAGSCQLTVPAAWSVTSRSVALLQFVSDTANYVCTGTLLNSQASDLTPYLLTANHCFSTQSAAQSVRVVWRFDTSGQSVSSRTHSDETDLLLTRSLSSGSDYTLLMVKGTLPSDLSSLTWAGWTTSMPGLFTSVVGLHHPGGTPNGDPYSLADAYTRYSIGDVGTGFDCQPSPGSNFLPVDWDIGGGQTEQGSSGSGLWIDNTSNPQLVGQLYGGCSSCAVINRDSWYGKFSTTYSDINTNSNPNYMSAGRDDDFTPNNTRATARLVSPGNYNSRIVKYYSEDWYRISVPAGATIATSLAFTHAYGDIDLELYRGNDASPVATSGGTSNSESVQVINSGSTSDYYAHVYLFRSTRNSYSISVSVTTVDNTPPSVSITFPTNTGSWTATSSNLSIAGNASDNVGVTQVSWATDRGVSGTAVGTSPTWSASGITIFPGTNNLTVTARDAAGNTGTARLVVSYFPAPTVTTNAATNVGQTAATLNAAVNPNASSTSVFFAYGTAPNPGSPTTPAQQVGSGTSAVAVSANVSGLQCSTAYYFHAIASSTQGTPVGSDRMFTTSQCTCSVGVPVITAPNSVIANSSGNIASATATGAVSYSWSIANGAITSAANQQSIAFAAGPSGQLTLAVTATASGGCSAQSQVNVSITAASARGIRGDHDGNRISDIFWRDISNGNDSIWYVNGGGFLGGPAVPVMSTDYSLIATGDFNNDGKSDALWRSASSGAIVIWFLNGGIVTGTLNLPGIPTFVTVAGVGDFNGDGYADILWRNAQTGDDSIWYITAAGWVGGGATLPNINLNLAVISVADFNNDGKADILWRNTTTGDLYTWLMNGGTIAGGSYLGAIPLAVTLLGTGDFNGDGSFDLLWRNFSNGTTSVWFLSNGAFGGTGLNFGSIPGPVNVVAVGDFNGDGFYDLLWRNETSGGNSIWFIGPSGFTGAGISLPAIAGSTLKIVSPAPR